MFEIGLVILVLHIFRDRIRFLFTSRVDQLLTGTVTAKFYC
jgi:hypothetical protein